GEGGAAVDDHRVDRLGRPALDDPVGVDAAVGDPVGRQAGRAVAADTGSVRADQLAVAGDRRLGGGDARDAAYRGDQGCGDQGALSRQTGADGGRIAHHGGGAGVGGGEEPV